MSLQHVYNRITVSSGVDMMQLLYNKPARVVDKSRICQLQVLYPTRSLRCNAFGYSFRKVEGSNWFAYDLPLSQILKNVITLFCQCNLVVIHELSKQVVEFVTTLCKL
jgi:hypothetical protein